MTNASRPRTWDFGSLDCGTVPSLHELEERMRPGACSEKGFLWPTESLEAVIDHDNQTLIRLGVSHDQIADALEHILQRLQDDRDWEREAKCEAPDLYHPRSIPHYGLGNLPATDVGYLVGSKHQLLIQQYRGWQDCPWGCPIDAGASSFDFLILNRQSGKFVTGPGLIVHLIRKHHFFEGLGTPFRLDPARAVEVLELTGHPASADRGVWRGARGTVRFNRPSARRPWHRPRVAHRAIPASDLAHRDGGRGA